MGLQIVWSGGLWPSAGAALRASSGPARTQGNVAHQTPPAANALIIISECHQKKISRSGLRRRAKPCWDSYTASLARHEGHSCLN